MREGVDRLQLRPGQVAAGRAAENVPLAAGLGIDDAAVFYLEGERPSVDLTIEKRGHADIARLVNAGGVQRADRARLPDGYDIPLGETVIDDDFLRQGAEGVGDADFANGRAENALGRHQPPVRRAHEQEGTRAAVVIDVGIAAVEAPLRRQHFALRILRFEGAVTDQLRRHDIQQRARMRADDALAGQLLPERLRHIVPHDQVAVAQQAADAEAQGVVADAPVEDDGAVAERAEGHGDRRIADDIVGDLMPRQNRQRIGARDTIDFQRDDWRAGLQPQVGRRQIVKLRIIDWRDAIAPDAARHNLVEDALRALADIGEIPDLLPIGQQRFIIEGRRRLIATELRQGHGGQQCCQQRHGDDSESLIHV